MSTTDQLLKNNDAYRKDHPGRPLPARPSRRVAVVTCMDARIDIYRALGLEAGEAHVIRNAGGGITDDVIRSLMLSQRLLGTEEVVLIRHTDCGLQTFTDDAVKDEVEREVGVRPPFALGGFADLDEAVSDSIRQVRQSPFLPHRDQVRGFVFNVATGVLREVTAA